MPPEILDLDAQATSPLHPQALAAMLPHLQYQHWNPHSAHRGGRRAKAAVEAARTQVATALARDPSGLIFTSGATEANNLAIKGTLEARPGRLLTFATEHSCVLETARHLQRNGTPVTILPVARDGLPDRAAYTAALAANDVTLVSAMWVNNEVGTIWPIADMAAEAHAAGALFHTDAAQAFTKLPLDAPQADLISLSAHKIGGPKGIGALWVRPGLTLAPLLDGGGQEGTIRSGTQSPALAAGFGAAAALANPAQSYAQATTLMAQALEALAAIPHTINGPDPTGPHRWPGNLSVTLPVDSARLISALPTLALASGSACSSGSGRPSHVLAALGLDTTTARRTLRLGWQPAMPPADLETALSLLTETVKRLA
jgi:cysteine desulfurase